VNSKNRKIIIVDDIPLLSDFMKDVLEENGYKNVECFDDAYLASDAIKTKQDAFIICDYNLNCPAMTGIQLLDGIKGQNETIEAVIATSDVGSVENNFSKYPVLKKGPDFESQILYFLNRE